MRRWLIAAISVSVMAGLMWTLRTREPPEVQYRLALKLLRDGDSARAAKTAKASESIEDPEWRARFRLLEVEALLDSGKGDLALARLDSMSAGDSVEQNVRGRVLRARRMVGKGDLASAQTLLSDAQRISQEKNRPDLDAEIELALGQTLARQQRLPDAEIWFLAARKSAIASGDKFRQGSAVNNLGMVQMIRSHCDEAIPLFDEAQNLYRAAGANHWVVAARNNIGLCYYQLGDLDNAFTYRQAALELSRPSALKAAALAETGRVLLAKDPGSAVPLFRQARDMARQFGALPEAARSSINLAQALATTGDWDGSEAAIREAKELGLEPRSIAYLDLNSAAIALGRGRPAEARTTYERTIASSPDNPPVLWKAHAGIAATYIATGQVREALNSFEAATHVVETAQSDVKRDELKLTFLAELIRLYQDYVELLMSQNEPVRALAVADRSRARLLGERLSRRVGRGKELSAEDFRGIAKTSGSTWLAYWIAPKRSFLWVVKANDVRAFILPGEEEITKLVTDYRAFIVTSLRDPMLTKSESGEKLYQTLIAPACPLLPSGSTVTIIPDGALHQLNFDALPVYGEGTPRYFIDDATVAVIPSFGVFGGKHPSPISGKDGLIIGDAITASPAFPPLKYAGREIARVASRMNSNRTKVITGVDARPEVWKTASPGDFSTIHIAAHAEANERSPLDSAIILSPGSGYRLYARDVIDVNLRADMVTLSACRSSGARTYAGEGMVGFAWAFLHAGARSVVAGLWDVADESTSLLMDNLYGAIAAGSTPADALRRAQLSVRKTEYSKPFYWGAFQCYLR